MVFLFRRIARLCELKSLLAAMARQVLKLPALLVGRDDLIGQERLNAHTCETHPPLAFARGVVIALAVSIQLLHCPPPD